MTKLYPPLPELYLNSFATRLFTSISQINCTSCFFVAGGGKRTLMKYFLHKKSLLKSIFKKKLEKYLFIYIHPDDIKEISTTSYLELMNQRLIRLVKRKKIQLPLITNGHPLDDIKKNLKQITDSGYNVVFILNDFEFTLQFPVSIYLNLESIMSVNKSQITYLFLISKNLLAPHTIDKLYNLKYAISQKIIYYPILDYENSRYIIQQIIQNKNINLNDSLIKLLYEVCGGHPHLLKYATHILLENIDVSKSPSEIKQLLLHHNQLQIICSDIWNNLFPEEQKIVIEIVKTGKCLDTVSINYQFLSQLKLILTDENRKYKLFSEIFTNYIKNNIPQEKLVYDPATNQIYYGLSRCGDLFTLQEFKLLVYLINHEGTVISRDDVAEVLWSKESYDKYSDYTIDKIMSMTRKKLDTIGYPSDNITTLKKRGFCLNQ